MKYLMYLSIALLTVLFLSMNVKLFELIKQTDELNNHLQYLERLLGESA